jgi:hypothetical protein
VPVWIHGFLPEDAWNSQFTVLFNVRAVSTWAMTSMRDSVKLGAMRVLLVSLLVVLLSACSGGLWNDPYPASDQGKSIF